MKRKMLPIIAVFMLTAGLSMSAAAAPSVASALGTIGSAIKSGSTKFCEAGSLLSLKFSVRFFNGALCTNRIVAAIATALCKNAPGFRESKCNANARIALGKKPLSPVEVEEVKKTAGTKAEAVIEEVEEETAP